MRYRIQRTPIEPAWAAAFLTVLETDPPTAKRWLAAATPLITGHDFTPEMADRLAQETARVLFCLDATEVETMPTAPATVYGVLFRSVVEA